MDRKPSNTNPGRGLKKSSADGTGTIEAREKRLFAVLTAMVYAYPNQGTEAPTLEQYLHHLVDLPVDLVATACDRLVKKKEFLPSISEIRELVGALVDQVVLDRMEQQQIEEARRLEAYTGPPTPEAIARARDLLSKLAEDKKWPKDGCST